MELNTALFILVGTLLLQFELTVISLRVPVHIVSDANADRFNVAAETKAIIVENRSIRITSIIFSE